MGSRVGSDFYLFLRWIDFNPITDFHSRGPSVPWSSFFSCPHVGWLVIVVSGDCLAGNQD